MQSDMLHLRRIIRITCLLLNMVGLLSHAILHLNNSQSWHITLFVSCTKGLDDSNMSVGSMVMLLIDMLSHI